MSSIVPIFQGKIEDCILIYDERDKFNAYLTTLNGPVEVIVRKPRKVRSSQQNKYYWGVILKLISEHTGESIDDLHNHFSYKYLSMNGKSGKLHSKKSTTSLSTIEFMEYINKIIQWGEQFLNINFPEPEDVDYDFAIV